MAYTDFDLLTIQHKLGVTNQLGNLFDAIVPISQSEWLQQALNMAGKLPIKSEKARSELIVTPILMELWNSNNQFFTIYSGDTLNADDALGLRGECDFILTKNTGSFNINMPIIQVVEAKKNDLEIGIPQCASQMIGASIFNEKNNTPVNRIYGCVTTGDAWQFLMLENKQITIDYKKYYLGNVPELLGVFQVIIDYYKKVLV